MRRTLFSTILALALALTPALGTLVATIVQISEDRYSNPSSQHQTQVEPDTYAFGSTVVATTQTGRFFDGGASNVAWATSLDGGATWTDGDLPGTTVFASPPGTYDRVSDPSVAYDAEHDVWIISTLGMDGTTGIAVLASRSTDGGLTWENPVVVSEKPGGFYDKNWITCDNWPSSPFYGNCYVTWDDAFLGNRLLNSTSTDGGLTWGPKLPTANSAGGIGAQPLVRPNGTVIVPVANAFGSSLMVYASLNGGASWTRTRNIANVNSHSVAGGLRAPTYLASAEVDAAGTVYLVWASCRFRSGCSANDIVMTTSTNGRNWTPVVRIPIDDVTSGIDHFIPGIAVDPATSGATARLGVTYYFYPDTSCSFATCELMVGSIASADGGTTWTLPETLAGPISLSWIADTSQGRMVGDYISTSFAGNAVGVFSNAFTPSGGMFDQAEFASFSPVTYGAEYPLVVREDPVLSFQSDYPIPTTPVVIP